MMTEANINQNTNPAQNAVPQQNQQTSQDATPISQTSTNNNGITDLANGDPEKYLEYLLDLMIKHDSSDIYLTYGEEPTLRIFGEARRIVGLPKLEDKTLDAFSDFIMNEEDKELFKKNLSVDIGLSMHGRRYRVNISRQRDHMMIVARLLEEKVPTIDERGLPEIFKRLSGKTNGVIFVAGPTGSGKSTTLAAMIEEINMGKQKHIITIEDPIEYIFEPKKAIFEQKQLGKDIVTFASAMKYALRQRPDVILFGEIRDPESLRNAIALAETGHLVLTTIHSRSAEQTINKVISMFPADEQPQIRNQISENMTAIIIQKLIRKADGKGMIPAHEILLNNIAVENTIRENKLNQIKNVMYTNRNSGMQLLEDHLVQLVEAGLITPEAAMANANDHGQIQRELIALGYKIQ
ncbi:MAG: PilT/PilU family type 4a pilus ATPase [Candidatus Absconditabacteria bacterium]|nr:PilT/PilU family type 4a pilus ATPase [Candidatus Absconditabacteria bacterium]